MIPHNLEAAAYGWAMSPRVVDAQPQQCECCKRREAEREELSKELIEQARSESVGG